MAVKDTVTAPRPREAVHSGVPGAGSTIERRGERAPAAPAAPGPHLFDPLLAALLGVATVLVLLITAPFIGLTWDEPAYIAAAESYIRWFGTLAAEPAMALSASGIREAWEPNHEHPPLDKIWSGLVWLGARNIFGDLIAHRLGNMLLVGGLVAMLYLMVGDTYGRRAGLAAIVALLALPRFFLHAHLAALDVPAAVAVIALLFLFWRTYLRPGWRWTVLLGVAWGLALAVKVNAAFVLPVVFVWSLIFHRRIYLLVRVALAGVIGVPISLLVWPWLYHDPLRRFGEYLAFLTYEHWQIGQWYLGRFWMPPPWHFPFVMLVAVVPLGLLILFTAAVARLVAQRRSGAMGWLFVGSLLISLLALTTGRTMVYDNERLFMPAFPSLAALAGIGFDWIVRGLGQYAVRLRRPRLARPLAIGLAAVCFGPPLVASYQLFPHLLSYYSAAVGELPGAVRMGLESTYWCETYAEALPFLNTHAKPGDTVWVEDYSHDVMLYYQLQGKLRPDVRVAWVPGAITVFRDWGATGYDAGRDNADWVVIQHRQTGFKDERPSWLDGRQPSFQLSYWNVPLLSIYEQ